MLTTKKTFQTKFLSTLLILALVSTMILAPTALAAGFGGSSITTAVADSGVRNFTPTEAANDTEIQAMTDNSSVLNESDIIYMILTDRFYDADPTNNGTLNQEYRPDSSNTHRAVTGRVPEKVRRYLNSYTRGAALLPLHAKNCHKEINMNRLRTLVGILLVILGLTGLLGCNRGPQRCHRISTRFAGSIVRFYISSCLYRHCC